ncbi:MAG: tRNA-splicing ligase RtcB [Paraglaciecola sp.]|jgi:tRNA-splicing ligase RtcB
MARIKLRGKDLLKLGYPDGSAIGMAINMVLSNYKRKTKDEVLTLLKDVLDNQTKYAKDPILGRIVRALNPSEKTNQETTLVRNPEAYKTYGELGVEAGATKKMDTAMRLPMNTRGCIDGRRAPRLRIADWWCFGDGECHYFLRCRNGYWLSNVFDGL